MHAARGECHQQMCESSGDGNRDDGAVRLASGQRLPREKEAGLSLGVRLGQPFDHSADARAEPRFGQAGRRRLGKAAIVPQERGDGEARDRRHRQPRLLRERGKARHQRPICGPAGIILLFGKSDERESGREHDGRLGHDSSIACS